MRKYNVTKCCDYEPQIVAGTSMRRCRMCFGNDPDEVEAYQFTRAELEEFLLSYKGYVMVQHFEESIPEFIKQWEGRK